LNNINLAKGTFQIHHRRKIKCFTTKSSKVANHEVLKIKVYFCSKVAHLQFKEKMILLKKSFKRRRVFNY